jgi:hypothetical protein
MDVRTVNAMWLVCCRESGDAICHERHAEPAARAATAMAEWAH